MRDDFPQCYADTAAFFAEFGGAEPPPFIIDPNKDPLPPTAEDELKTVRVIKALRKHGRAHPTMMHLANCIENDPKAVNAASIIYMRTFQKDITANLLDIYVKLGRPLSVICLVHPKACAIMGNLDGNIFEGLAGYIRRTLYLAGINRAFGALDLLAREHEENSFPAHYQSRAWIFAPANEVRGGEKIFRDRFPRSRTVLRPVVIREWDGNPETIAAAFAPEFKRSISLAYRQRRGAELSPRQRAEILLAMYHAGPVARAFKFNV